MKAARYAGAVALAAVAAFIIAATSGPSPSTLTASRTERHPCTTYVAPHGRAGATGKTLARPTTLAAAAGRARAGTTVCLTRGTYPARSTLRIPRGGSRRRPVVVRAVGGRAVLEWRSNEPGFMVQVDASHVSVSGITFDGRGTATMAVKGDTGCDHLTVQWSTIKNMGAAGIMTKRCDYVRIIGNRIYRTGYDPRKGWSSAISLNTNVWADRYPGFHSVVARNIISGATDESHHHTEGSGVIIDRGGPIPPVLITNNVIYQNGDHCVNLLDVSNAWVVANTCYKNGLDIRQKSSEITAQGNKVGPNYLIDNAVMAWKGRPPIEIDHGGVGDMSTNIAYGTVPSAVAPDTPRRRGDIRPARPSFVHPPTVFDQLGGQQYRAIAPWEIGSRLAPSRDSVLINAGRDPLRARGLNTWLRRDMQRYLARDVDGSVRPQGRRWDIGAYEVG